MNARPQDHVSANATSPAVALGGAIGHDDGPGVWLRLMRSAAVRQGAGVAFIVVAVLGAYWRLTLMRGVLISDDIFASDLMNENFPYRFSLGEALRAGQWPLWVREIYGGFPLLARSESGVCYPFNLILYGLLSPYAALNASILLLLVTAGVGMYFYVREIGSPSGGSLWAATVAGVAFSFSGFLVSHLKHLSMANGAAWLPLALALLERAVKTRRSRPLIWFGLVFGLQHLSGNAQIPYYCGALYVVYFALRLLHDRRRPLSGATGRDNARLVVAFAAVMALSVLLAAVQLIPTYQLVSLSDRSSGVSFDYASRYPYDLKSFWSFFYPYANGDVGDLSYSGSGVFWEDYGYVGVLTMLLALAAPVLWRKRKNWHVRFFSAVAVISYLLVLGPATPLFKLVFTVVPGMGYFRFPTRLLLITDASLIILAALSITTLFAGRQGSEAAPLAADTVSGQRRQRWTLFVQAAILAAVTGELLYFQMRQNPTVNAAVWRRPPATAEVVRQDHSLFRIFSVGGNHAHKRAFHQAGGWEGDLQPFVQQREFIQPSSNVLYGIASPNGYANLTPRYLVDVWGDQNRAGIVTGTAALRDEVFQPTQRFWKLMRMYNVKYLTSFWPFQPSPNLRALGNFGGAYLYQNDEVLPRAYLVRQAVTVADDTSALRTLLSDDFHPEQSVVLIDHQQPAEPGQPLKLPTSERGGAAGTVRFLDYRANGAELETRDVADALLVFSDSYYPGWVAKVDGRETAIYRANLTQRAVVVPAGQHRVAFTFRPAAVRIGAWISAASLAAFLGWLLLASRSRPPLSRPAGVA